MTDSSRSAPLTRPGSAWIVFALVSILALRSSSASNRFDGADQLVVGPVVGREAFAETRLPQPLRVVVLIPEQRKADHRQAEVEALAHRVVAAVRDQQIALRQDRRLRQELIAVHVRPERHLVLQRSHRHDRAVLGLGHRVDQALHQPHVHATERPERQVDDLALARHVLVDVERRVARPHRGVQPVPRGVERPRPRVVGHLGEQVEVAHGELVLNSSSGHGATPTDARKSLCSRSRSSCWAWYSSRNACHSLRSSIGRPDSTGGRSGSRISSGFAETNRTHGHARELDRRVAGDVVGATTSGRMSSQISMIAVVGVLRARDERLPDRLGHRRDLLDRGLAELRCGHPDELGPRVGGRDRRSPRAVPCASCAPRTRASRVRPRTTRPPRTRCGGRARPARPRSRRSCSSDPRRRARGRRRSSSRRSCREGYDARDVDAIRGQGRSSNASHGPGGRPRSACDRASRSA